MVIFALVPGYDHSVVEILGQLACEVFEAKIVIESVKNFFPFFQIGY
jgi:hypothetical protein